MADTDVAPLSAEEQAQLAALTARKMAADAAAKQAGAAAFTALIARPEWVPFKGILADAQTAIRAANAGELGLPDLDYALGCMQRLEQRYGA